MKKIVALVLVGLAILGNKLGLPIPDLLALLQEGQTSTQVEAEEESAPTKSLAPKSGSTEQEAPVADKKKPQPEAPAAPKPEKKPKAEDLDAPWAKMRMWDKAQRSDMMIEGKGTIVHVLPKDLEGSRHQRWLVEGPKEELTIKISHNIDLAPEIPAKKGDTLHFKGEYEANDKGGVVHWTHHDPRGKHEGGWIIHNGKKYE